MTGEEQREGAEWMRNAVVLVLSPYDGGRDTEQAKLVRVLAAEVVAISLPEAWRLPSEKKAGGVSPEALAKLAEIAARHVEPKPDEEDECPF